VVQEGPHGIVISRGNLNNCRRGLLQKGSEGMAIPNMGKLIAKHGIQSRVDLCKGI
jgi:hypothetical protein